MAEDTQSLGGIIEINGFKGLDGGTMIVLKKIIGSYARKFSDNIKGFKKLKISLDALGQKKVIAEIIIEDSIKTFDSSDENIFVSVDSCLKKAESELIR